MNKKTQQNKSSTGLIIKVLIPVTAILVVVFFLYWGAQAAKDPNRSTHEMADGVAKFYSTFKKSFDDEATQLDDSTILLPTDGESVLDKLQYRSARVTPASKNWQGESKRRRFKENGTIKTTLESFAIDEDIEVMWDLKYDYIIKHHFVEQSNLKALIDKITRTVNSDYDGDVKSYFCPNERAIVITDKLNNHIKNNCVITTSKRRLALEERRAEQYKQRQNLLLDKQE